MEQLGGKLMEFDSKPVIIKFRFVASYLRQMRPTA